MANKDANTWKRSVVEYLVIGGIILFLYSTGYYVEVIGRLQQLVLWTGLIQPNTEQPIHDLPKAKTDMPLVAFSGEQTSLNSYQGKVIFLNFWATWCPPCVAEMPDIQSLYGHYKDNPNIVFIMVSVDQDPVKARNFIKRKGFTFPVFMPAGAIPKVFQSQVVPTTFIINQGGEIVLQRNGMAKYNTEKFRTFLDAVISRSQGR